METPDVYVLSRIDWQLWCTLTFKREVSNSVQASMFLAWTRKLSRYGGVKPENLLWVCRRELGEVGSRRHFHALVAGLPDWVPTQNVCWHFMQLWRDVGGGHPQIWLFQHDLAGVEYTLKNLERDGAEQYECRKFGAATTVTLSEGLVRKLAHKKRARQGQSDRMKTDTLPQVAERAIQQFGCTG